MPTDQKVAEALEGAIKHWQYNLTAVREVLEPSFARYSCPLCALFGNSCDGCPIAERTGLLDCKGTPYSAAIHAWWRVEDYPFPEYHKECQAMLDFLKSLRK